MVWRLEWRTMGSLKSDDIRDVFIQQTHWKQWSGVKKIQVLPNFGHVLIDVLHMGNTNQKKLISELRRQGSQLLRRGSPHLPHTPTTPIPSCLFVSQIKFTPIVLFRSAHFTIDCFQDTFLPRFPNHKGCVRGEKMGLITNFAKKWVWCLPNPINMKLFCLYSKQMPLTLTAHKIKGPRLEERCGWGYEDGIFIERIL